MKNSDIEFILKMARETQDVYSERLSMLLRDILISNPSSNKEKSRGQVFHDIIHNLSKSYSSNLPPLLLTAEDRKQLQYDRQKAIECEQQLAIRRQEKHFDLVDKIQSVLQRIEEKKPRKDNMSDKTSFDISNSENTPPKLSSDYNNNPSPTQPETYFEDSRNTNSKPINRRVSSEHHSNWENSGQQKVIKRKNNSGRYSLPADFETQHNFSISGHRGSEPIMRYHSGMGPSRPESMFSEHSSFYTNSLHLPEESTRQFPEAQNQSFSSTWQTTSGTQNWGSSFSVLDNSHMSPSSDSHSMINRQRELLALEQKQLEDHFSALQGQLLAEFQQRQNELLETYKGSMESGAEKSMQSILERSYESSTEGTVVDTSDKENFVLNCTDELPKSPFSLTPKKTLNASQKLTPNVVGVSTKSFNSEASVQEFYDITHFGATASEKGSIEKRKTRNEIEKKVEKKKVKSLVYESESEKKSAQNFGSKLITSPKLRQLNSFESQTKAIKNVHNHKFHLVSAYAKGYLTRLLFQTAKINSLVMTVKDAKNVLNEMKSETNQSMTDRSFKERVKAQLQSAQSELCEIFLDSSSRVRMQILEHNRRLLKEKKTRNENKVTAKISSQTRPKLSNATMKKRLSRQERQEKKAKSPNTADTSSVSAEKTTTPKSRERNEAKKLSHVVTMTTAKSTCAATGTATSAEKHTEMRKTAISTSKPLSKGTKPSNNVAVATKKKRRTWDAGVLKPIQGRISPTIPDKTRLSGEKKQSLSSAARKTGQKLASDYRASAGARGTSGTSGTSGNTRINSKTYKIDNKQGHRVTRPGAKRSLAANLSNN